MWRDDDDSLFYHLTHKDMSAAYCIEHVSTCPTGGEEICPRLLSVEADGEGCRAWKKAHPGEANRAMSYYCARNREAPQCLCINRHLDPLYSRLRPRHNDDRMDAYWWKPCHQGSNYLIPESTYFNSAPSYVEGQRISRAVNRNFQRQGIFNQDQASPFVNADLTGGETGWWGLYRWWIFGVTLFIILVVLMVIVIYIIKQRKKRADI